MKYLSLILLLSFITIVLTFIGSCPKRENLENSSQFNFQGCYSNNPRVFSNWDPNDLKSNPDRNSICENSGLVSVVVILEKCFSLFAKSVA